MKGAPSNEAGYVWQKVVHIRAHAVAVVGDSEETNHGASLLPLSPSKGENAVGIHRNMGGIHAFHHEAIVPSHNPLPAPSQIHIDPFKHDVVRLVRNCLCTFPHNCFVSQKSVSFLLIRGISRFRIQPSRSPPFRSHYLASFRGDRDSICSLFCDMIVTKTHGEMETKNGGNLVPSSAQGCLEYRRLHSVIHSPFTWILLRNPTCIRRMEHTPPCCGMETIYTYNLK